MYAHCQYAYMFTISTQAPVEGMVICAVLVTLFVFVANRAPNQRTVYLLVFPAVIAVFLLLPFFSDVLSRAYQHHHLFGLRVHVHVLHVLLRRRLP